MARDAGAKRPASGGTPPKTLGPSIVEVQVSDPLDGSSRFLYLFQKTGPLDPGAGQQLVSYSFELLDCPQYLGCYGILEGPNPEDSEVVSSHYRVHFSDRWIRDETGITSGGSSGVDVLDRHKTMFAPGDCASPTSGTTRSARSA